MYRIHVEADEFKGQSIVKQHQAVTAALKASCCAQAAPPPGALRGAVGSVRHALACGAAGAG